MDHDLNDIWNALNKLCNRMTALETKYDEHIQRKITARERRANWIALAAVTVAAVTFFVSQFK